MNYRNQIVKGAVKQNISAFNKLMNDLASGEINVRDSGPRNVRVSLVRNSDEYKLMVEKGFILDLFSKARELANNLPPKGQTNGSLDDFDASAKRVAQTYNIPIKLTPI